MFLRLIVGFLLFLMEVGIRHVGLEVANHLAGVEEMRLCLGAGHEHALVHLLSFEIGIPIDPLHGVISGDLGHAFGIRKPFIELLLVLIDQVLLLFKARVPMVLGSMEYIAALQRVIAVRVGSNFVIAGLWVLT